MALIKVSGQLEWRFLSLGGEFQCLVRLVEPSQCLQIFCWYFLIILSSSLFPVWT